MAIIISKHKGLIAVSRSSEACAKIIWVSHIQTVATTLTFITSYIHDDILQYGV